MKYWDIENMADYEEEMAEIMREIAEEEEKGEWSPFSFAWELVMTNWCVLSTIRKSRCLLYLVSHD